MSDVALFVLPRVLHVLGVVLWIGGVALVATVVLPALRRSDDAQGAYRIFQEVLRRFVWQARITTLIVGLSGFTMLSMLHGWGRYLSGHYWWVWAMTLVWLLFTVILFVAEPLSNRRGDARKMPDDPRAALRALQRAHWVLLGLSLVTIAGAVAGAHGWFWF